MYIDNYMYDVNPNERGEVPLKITIPKDYQDETIMEIEIRIPEIDLRRMLYSIELQKRSQITK